MGKPEESIFGYLTEFWSEERKMTGFLAALIFDTLIVYPLVSAVSSSVGIQIINILVILCCIYIGAFCLNAP